MIEVQKQSGSVLSVINKLTKPKETHKEKGKSACVKDNPQNKNIQPSAAVEKSNIQ